MKATANGLLVTSQGRICALCGKRFSPNLHSTEDRWQATVDHVWPIAKGGYDGKGNIVAAHKKCNNDKGQRRPTGCEIIWLVAVCERNRWPIKLKPDSAWQPNAPGSGLNSQSRPPMYERYPGAPA